MIARARVTMDPGSLLAGLVIDLVGLSPGLEPGQVEPHDLTELGWFTIVLTSGMALAAAGFYRRIHMGRDDLTSIRRQLSQRAAG